MRGIVTGLLTISGVVAFIAFAVNVQWGYAIGSAVAAGLLIAAFNAVWLHAFGLHRRLRRHLGRRWEKGEIVHQPVPSGDRVNVQAALDRMRAEAGTPGPFGVPRLEGIGEASHRLRALRLSDAESEPIEYEPFPSGSGRTLECAGNALYLLRSAEGPVAALITGEGDFGRLEVLAATKAVGRAFLQAFERRARGQPVPRHRPVGRAGEPEDG